MGGKSKQSQRTKNNARPSSSSRSAELLNSSTGLDGGLLTLGSGKPLPPLFPTLAAANLEQGLNPEFQMCIKKLNKKDPITRTKALQELCELINNGDVEDVVAALPSWAHFYKILTADTDRKVREMTQVCHGAALRAAGRRAAPQLRALLPAWLTAQYDDHAPAQAQAQLSLTRTFPDNKLPEVISFCKAEVIAHLLDNLNGNTEALLKKRIENAEERELQMNRILTSSLQGLQYFVQHLPAAHDAWLWGELAPLLQHAFWKLPQSTPHVRAAWLCALGALAARWGGAVGAGYGGRALRLLLADTREPAPLWGCLLQIMQHVPDWHTYLDKKELLVKRIIDLLENGGWGDAKQLSNMLLPLLAYLPQDILTKDFYEAFFRAMFNGLEKKNILSSKSERQAWITSLAECLRYVSIQPREFVPELATSTHRAWLGAALGPHAAQLGKPCAAHMASLLKYWLKLSQQDKTEKYDHLVRNFWQNVTSTILAQIDKAGSEHDEIAKVIDGHIAFLQMLKTSFCQEAKKQQSIKFEGSAAPPAEAAGAAEPCDAALAVRFQHALAQCVQGAAAACLRAGAAAALAALLAAFGSAALLAALAAQVGGGSAHALYERALRPRLASDATRCAALVDVVFLALQYMTEQEQDAVFDTFQHLPLSAVEWCVRAAASHPHLASPAAQRWLRSEAVAPLPGALAERGAAGDSGAAALLLRLLGAPGGWQVSGAGVAGAVRAACAALERAEGEALAGAAALGARLAVALAGSRAPHYARLLLQLLRLDVLVPRGDARLAADAWCEVRSSWADGAGSLAPHERPALLQRVAAFLREQLQLTMDKLDIARIENIMSPCPHLFKCCDETGAPEDVTEIANFTKSIFDTEDEDSLAVECDALRYECVTSRLNCLFEDDNEAIAAVIRSAGSGRVRELSAAQLLRHAARLLARAALLCGVLQRRAGAAWGRALLHDEYLRDQFCTLYYDYIVIDSLHDGYAFKRHCDVVAATRGRLRELLARAAAPAGEPLQAALRARAAARAYLWPRAALCHQHMLQPAAEPHHDPLDTTPAGESQDTVPADEPQDTGPADSPQDATPADEPQDTGLADEPQDTTPADEPQDTGPADEPQDTGPADEPQDTTPADKPQDTLPANSPQDTALADSLDGHKLEDVVSGNGYFHTLQASTTWRSEESEAAAEESEAAEAAYETARLVMLRSWLAAHGDCGDAGLDGIVNAYYRSNHTMLYDRDISECSWREVVSNAAVVEFLSHTVTSRGWHAPPHHWDFVSITLCSLLNSLRKSMEQWGSARVALLARAVLRLWARVRRFVRDVPARGAREQPAAHVAALPREWDDMFAPDTHYNLFALALHLLECCNESEMTSPRIEVIGALIECLKLSDWFALNAAHRRSELSLARLLPAAAAALQRPPHHAAAWLAYHLLLALAGPLVLDDAEKLAQWSDGSEAEEAQARPALSVELLHDAFERLHDIVDAALASVVLGEGTCEMVPMSDSYNAALAWLLLGAALAALASRARGDLAQQYGAVWRDRRAAERTLGAALRLLPPAVWAACCDNPSPAPPQHHDLFLVDHDFSVHEAASSRAVSALACRALYGCVTGAGAAGARGWWGAAGARAGRLLARLVRVYVAPPAVREQLRELQRRAAEIDDAEIHIAWSSSEVTCWYSVEERRVELRVWLAREHPLVAPRLAAGGGGGGVGANTHWLALYLAYQNGTLLNALKMWTAAVNARVESAPQCYICYCRLHPASGRLPRVPCHQCRNKFHNVCLRKWFATSNKSSCPLCRSPF
nr:E3 ubiquitin-protein ligase listerin isoform X3 [Helicoverpa armigera]